MQKSITIREGDVLKNALGFELFVDKIDIEKNLVLIANRYKEITPFPYHRVIENIVSGKWEIQKKIKYANWL